MSKRKTRLPDDPYTVADLCRVTGWSRPTVYAAIQAGQLPGYQSGPGGKWFVPAVAFRSLLAGTWTPQTRKIEITSITPVTRIDRKRRKSA
jgi:excisionase family DNA binding protein